MNKGEIILYQPDDTISLEVRIEDETVWLNRQQMAILFGRDVKTIGKHINNALSEELRDIPTVAKFATVQKEGKRSITRQITQGLAADLARHNQQYPPIAVTESPRFHDRFLIIDDAVYHIGASLKDLGKKLFAFSQMDIPAEWLV